MSKFASLTAGLLARKGEAEPTATPFADQLLTRVGAPSPDLRALTPMHTAPVHAHVEVAPVKPQGLKPPPAPKPLDPSASPFGTFGRRHMPEHKFEPLVMEPAKAPPLTVVPHHHEEEAESHCASCPGPTPEEATKTYHVNLRLKRQRFVKLKLSSALLRRPVQELVAEALDQWFDKLPPDVMGDCACLKARGD